MGMSRRLEIVGRNLLLDGVAERVAQSLSEESLESILLKGPTTVRWLYASAPRPYVDVDLLVEVLSIDRVEDVLRGAGFKPADPFQPAASSVPIEALPASRDWRDGETGAVVELHVTLDGLTVPPAEVWRVLASHTESLRLLESTAMMLDEPARCFVLAHHALKHPGVPQPLGDLRRAIEVAPFDSWQQAAEIARQLQAEAMFAAGLRLVDEGATLADRLGSFQRDPRAGLLQASAPAGAFFIERLRGQSGRRRLRLVLSEVVPPPAFMRSWIPLARKGFLGLAAAYLCRLVWLVPQAIIGFRAWRRAAKGR